MELPFAESYKIKMVEPIRRSTRAEREKWLNRSLFQFIQPAKRICLYRPVDRFGYRRYERQAMVGHDAGR